MSGGGPLSGRIGRARAATAPEMVERARAALLAQVAAMEAEGAPPERIAARLADGSLAREAAAGALAATPPLPGLACASGCAFCCILAGDDGGTITEAEARLLHEALAPLAGRPDGRAWHPRACPALDPESRACRAYEARPVICRAYISTDAGACEAVAAGVPAPGPGTLGPYHAYLAAIALSRAALKGLRRVSTHSLARLAAAAVEGQPLDKALAASRHKPAGLEEEIRRSKRDLARMNR